MFLYVVLGIIVLIGLYVFIQYNTFINLKVSVEEAFATMDVYLKKRWDLIPNIVETVKGYVKHESLTIEKVVELRNLSYDTMSSDEKIITNEKIVSGLSSIMAVAENYPELKASQNFSELNEQLSKVEDEIANSRKYYNAVVKKMNIKIQMFPSNIVANIFKFQMVKMFETNEEEKKNVKVEF